MTEPYTYTDRYGDPIVVEADATDPPGVRLSTHPDDHYDWRTVPAADVPALVCGILAKAAAATGRDEADPLAHIRADLDATIDQPGVMYTQADVDASQVAQGRILDQHMPLLLALATAYLTDDDTELWAEIGRITQEGNWARETGEQARAEVKRLRAAAVDAAREHVAEITRVREAAHTDTNAAMDRADKAEADAERHRAEVEQLRAENEKLRAAVDNAGQGAALALRHFRARAEIDRLHADRVEAYGRFATAQRRADTAEAAVERAREFARTAGQFTSHDTEFAVYVRAMGDHLLRKLATPEAGS